MPTMFGIFIINIYQYVIIIPKRRIMEKQQNRQQLNEAKLKFAVAISYFSHTNFF